MVGAIGSKALDDVIIFESTDKRLLTFDGFNRTNTVRFAKHDILLKKPVSQYIGPDLDTISFSIMLRAQFGVDPRKEMDKLIYIHRSGEVISIIVGGKAFGMYRWRITDLRMDWEQIDNRGFLTAATCSISLEEYI